MTPRPAGGAGAVRQGSAVGQQAGRYQIGAGLWSMQSTAAAPASHPALYQELFGCAREVEACGFDAMWFAEHRFWYDGWLPSPMLAAAAAASATSRMRVGTAMVILPQHDPGRITRYVRTLRQLVGDRLELGVALGYRDEEYDGLGLERAKRGRRMEAALGLLTAKGPPGHDGDVRVWMGGIADAALDRGVRHGLSFMLPPTLTPAQVSDVVGRIRQRAAEHGVTIGRIGMVKDTWVDDDADRARRYFLPRLADAMREYGAWWVFRGQLGYERPDLVGKQVDRALAAALVGSPGDLVHGIGELFEAGVDELILHVHRDSTRARCTEALNLLGTDVLPTVRKEWA